MNEHVTPVSADDAGRILLVDDEATNLDILRQTLAGLSYRLFAARSGEDALKVARRARPLIVLLDVVMPGIDGYETCRRLKADPETRDAAVIFVSALNDPKDQSTGVRSRRGGFHLEARSTRRGDRARQYASRDPAPAPAPGRGSVAAGRHGNRTDGEANIAARRRPGRLGPPFFAPVTSSPSASGSSATWRKAAWASSTRRRISNCTSGLRSRPSCRTSP